MPLDRNERALHDEANVEVTLTSHLNRRALILGPDDKRNVIEVALVSETKQLSDRPIEHKDDGTVGPI